MIKVNGNIKSKRDIESESELRESILQKYHRLVQEHLRSLTIRPLIFLSFRMKLQEVYCLSMGLVSDISEFTHYWVVVFKTQSIG